VAGHLSLEFPGFAIHVEDPVAEEVFEGYVEKVLSLAVIVEVGLEDVLDNGECDDLFFFFFFFFLYKTFLKHKGSSQWHDYVSLSQPTYAPYHAPDIQSNI